MKQFFNNLWTWINGSKPLIRILGVSKPVFYLVFGSLFFSFICSCQKDGAFQQKDAFYKLSISWFYVYGKVAYDLEIDGKPVGTLSENYFGSMVFDTDVETPLKHLKIKAHGTGNVLLDTSMVFRGNALKLTQWFYDAPLCFGAVPFAETAPAPTDSSMCKYRITYDTLSNVPYDSVKVVFYTGNDVYKAYTLSAVDSVVARKGDWSAWLTLTGNPKGYASPVWLFKIYDAATNVLIQDISYKTTGSSRGFTKAVGYTNCLQTAGKPVYKFRRIELEGKTGSINGSYGLSYYESAMFDVLW
jgi:hypothetical protein